MVWLPQGKSENAVVITNKGESLRAFKGAKSDDSDDEDVKDDDARSTSGLRRKIGD
jgi:hypothetical protein